ncbi:MAG: TonB family protein [Cyanobacteria bacterium SZAS LIN-3]|nr:TonB family protein [Cyanobacteria bacterium SZAS LIN-3]
MTPKIRVTLFSLLLTASVGVHAGLADTTGSAEPTAIKSYYADIWSRIQKTWWVPEELMFKQVKLHMIIEKDGTLSSITMAQSSGDNRADTLALIGVKRASPFAPLPEGLPVPFDTYYTIGFNGGKDDKGWVIFNGKRYERGQAYTLQTGTKVGHVDRSASELDKQFHLKKEANLIKMNRLFDALATDRKAGAPTMKTAALLMDYAACLQVIQETAEAKARLSQALEIMEQNQASESELYPCLYQLAQLDYSIGDLGSAEPLYKKAIAIKEKSPPAAGVKDPEYKTMLETYAKLLYKQNRAGEADEIYKKLRSGS